MRFFETSAKTGQNVVEAFLSIPSELPNTHMGIPRRVTSDRKRWTKPWQTEKEANKMKKEGLRQRRAKWKKTGMRTQMRISKNVLVLLSHLWYCAVHVHSFVLFFFIALRARKPRCSGFFLFLVILFCFFPVLICFRSFYIFWSSACPGFALFECCLSFPVIFLLLIIILFPFFFFLRFLIILFVFLLLFLIISCCQWFCLGPGCWVENRVGFILIIFFLLLFCIPFASFYRGCCQRFFLLLVVLIVCVFVIIILVIFFLFRFASCYWSCLLECLSSCFLSLGLSFFTYFPSFFFFC